MVKNVRQLAISYFFPLPSLKKREEEKENKVAKLILNHMQNSSYRGLQEKG